MGLFLRCLLCGTFFFVQPAFADDAPSCSLVSVALKTAENIRGLRSKRSVPCALRNRNEVETFIRDSVQKKIPKERLVGDEATLKLLGLLPYDYNYIDSLVSLYGEQVAGFYDPESRSYAMAAWLPNAMQMPIAVHELTHALQDQHFSLKRFTDDTSAPTDVQLASSALVEGDATAVMIDYTRQLQGQGPIANEGNVSPFLVSNILGSLLTPTIHKTPRIISSLMIFPYISGLNFAHALLQKGGYKTLDRAFANPPIASSLILHPERFLEIAKAMNEPPSSDPSPSETTHRDRLGEFFLSVFLGTWIDQASATDAASDWRWDELLLKQKGPDSKITLRWTIYTRTESGLRKLNDAMRRALHSRVERKLDSGESPLKLPLGNDGAIQLTNASDKLTLEIEVSKAELQLKD